ncbi:MAG: hypothetical protein JW895_15640 [Thermoleophilaceae bacterium]|nr:hypothetical protein [Thermoleophilaceae bacterium]
MLRAGLSLATRAGGAVGRRLEDAGLWAIDAALSSRLAREAVDRTLESPLAERAVGRALEGPLVDAVARDVARYAVVERLMDRLIEESVLEHAVDRVLTGPELVRIADAVLEQVLDSDELWALVEEVAQSPAVTEAISRQGVSFADQVAVGVRARSHNADAWLERAARRALRRPPSERASP